MLGRPGLRRKMTKLKRSGNGGVGGGRRNRRGGVGGRSGAGEARCKAAVTAFRWRSGSNILRTAAICSTVMCGQSSSNLLTSEWSTKSSSCVGARIYVFSYAPV